MKCIYCGRLLARSEVAVCRTCRSNGQTPSGAVSQIQSLGLGEISLSTPPRTNRLGPILAGLFFGAVILVSCLSDTFYFAAFGTAARTGSEPAGAWLDLTLGRRFSFTGVVFDLGATSSKLEAAGVGRALLLMGLKTFSLVGTDYPNASAAPQKFIRRYVTAITPLTNEPALKGEKALALKGHTVAIEGFYARVDNGRNGTDTLEFTGGDTKLIYISTIVIDPNLK